jgi:hypothetical protein
MVTIPTLRVRYVKHEKVTQVKKERMDQDSLCYKFRVLQHRARAILKHVIVTYQRKGIEINSTK